MFESLIVTSMISSGALIAEFVKKYAERTKSAKEDYQNRSSVRIEVEQRRDSCINAINELQFEAALFVADPNLQQRIWCLLMEQMVLTYEAVTERELRMVEASLQQVKAALKSYREGMNYRKRVRVIGVGISFFVLAAIGIFLYFAPALGVSANSVITILGIPVSVLLWSIVGSFAAILYRFSMSGDRELEDPLRWFFSRPLTGVVMGSITFLVIKVGLLTFASGQNSEPTVASLGNKELMWLVAFLAGFSDRFSDGLLKSLIGRFGGDSNGELVTMGMTSIRQGTGNSQFSVIFDWITNRGNKEQGTAPPLSANNEIGKHPGEPSLIPTNGSKEKKPNTNRQESVKATAPLNEEEQHAEAEPESTVDTKKKVD